MYIYTCIHQRSALGDFLIWGLAQRKDPSETSPCHWEGYVASFMHIYRVWSQGSFSVVWCCLRELRQTHTIEKVENPSSRLLIDIPILLTDIPLSIPPRQCIHTLHQWTATQCQKPSWIDFVFLSIHGNFHGYPHLGWFNSPQFGMI